MNRDNVFLSREGTATKVGFLLKPIDHAQCFCFAAEFTPERLRDAGVIGDKGVYGLFPQFTGFMSCHLLADHARRASAIRREEAETCFLDLPPAWGISDALRAAWLDLICLRAAFLVSIFEE